MTTMQQQLKKLDILKKLSDDVEDLKQAMDFNNVLVKTLKEDNAFLRAEVNKLKKVTAELQQQNHKMSNDILDMQSRSMRVSIIIYGIPETSKETYQTSEQLVKSFMKDNLKMGERELETIRTPFENTPHRAG